jgi:hypothetical protein
MKTLWQIYAIARIEFRFGLRRSAPVVMTALIGLIVGTGILLMQISTLRDMTPTLNDMSPDKVARLTAKGLSVEGYQQLVTEFLGDMTSTSGATLGWVLMSMAILFLPIATVSIIPADRKFDVMEVLRSTPITGSVYLAGKVLGVLAIVLFSGLIPFLVFLAVLEGVLLNFLHIGISFSTLRFYIELSLLDGLPLLACGSMIGVLTGVVFRTRRAALFPGFLAGIISLFLWLTTFKPPSSSFPMTDVAEYYVFLNFHSEAESTLSKLIGIEGYGLLGPQPVIAGVGQLISMYMVVLLALSITALLARLWLQWKENF